MITPPLLALESDTPASLEEGHSTAQKLVQEAKRRSLPKYNPPKLPFAGRIKYIYIAN